MYDFLKYGLIAWGTLQLGLAIYYTHKGNSDASYKAELLGIAYMTLGNVQ